jgi:DNA primase
MSRISDAHLRRLRNEIPIRAIITALDLPTREVEGLFRFLCPRCNEFHTATNPRTNLARCFRCAENYNPIDLVMTVRRLDFLEAVRYLSSRVLE